MVCPWTDVFRQGARANQWRQFPGAVRRQRLLENSQEGAAMASATAGKATVSIEELVLAQTFELATLMNALERRGLLMQAEVLERP